MKDEAVLSSMLFNAEDGLKTLKRQHALMALRVRSFVRHEIGVDWRNKKLLLSLSGGIDSTALLCLLLALRPMEGFSIEAFHLDHALREESHEDADFVKLLCRHWQVPLYMRREDIAARALRCGIGEEEAGRNARREFLLEILHQNSADWVLLAHHSDDLAEDILMRLTRGAVWPALGGMQGCDNSGGLPLLRPLLMENKADLRKLLESLCIPWREDRTNAERIGRRNRMRLDVLPLLKEENPAFNDVARRLWRSARQDEQYWQKQLESLLQSCPVTDEGLLLPHDSLSSLPESTRLRFYMAALSKLFLSRGESRGQGRHKVLLALDRAVADKRHGKMFQFSGNTVAEVSARGVLFRFAGEQK